MIQEPMVQRFDTVTHQPAGVVPKPLLPPSQCEREAVSDAGLAARITKAASKQTYYIVRFLVDHDRNLAAYRAYAYFRWVDDRLDQPMSDRSARLAFIARQQDLVDCARHGHNWNDLTPEERLVVDLMASDDEPDSGLQSYISHMLAVMAFDAHRRGRWITEQELERYTQDLAIAITEALHYFIGHTARPPQSAARYLPATAAHITHMLRDTFEDVALGYINVPSELLQSSGMDPQNVQAAPYRAWVKRRVELARAHFQHGARYLDQVPSTRCRLAGYAYMARFAGVLDAIERDGYQLRPDYAGCTHPRYALRVSGSVVLQTLLGGTR